MTKRFASLSFVFLPAAVLLGGCATDEPETPEAGADEATAPSEAQGAAADGLSEEHAHPMMEFDTDGDGAVQLAEFLAGTEARFASADADGSGLVMGEEIPALAPKMGKFGKHRGKMGKKFDRLDADADGLVTQGEMLAKAEEKLAKYDDDENGVIDEAELPEGKKAWRLKKADTNDDGQITAAELADKKWSWMVSADENGDGAISRDEMESMKEAKMASFMLEKVDTDGDDAISLDESKIAAERFFGWMDKDESGALEASELSFKKGKHGKWGKPGKWREKADGGTAE